MTVNDEIHFISLGYIFVVYSLNRTIFLLFTLKTRTVWFANDLIGLEVVYSLNTSQHETHGQIHVGSINQAHIMPTLALPCTEFSPLFILNIILILLSPNPLYVMSGL